MAPTPSPQERKRPKPVAGRADGRKAVLEALDGDWVALGLVMSIALRLLIFQAVQV